MAFSRFLFIAAVLIAGSAVVLADETITEKVRRDSRGPSP
jgi:hypothetical protein